MASYCFPDICSWIQNLPPITQNSTTSSIKIYFSASTQQSLNFCILTKTSKNHDPYVSFSMLADFMVPPPISLWKSKSFRTKDILADEIISNLFGNLINDVLNYGPIKNTSFLNIPPLDTISHFNTIFNLSFFTLTLLICIYKVPKDLGSGCLDALEKYLTSSHCREVSKMLMRLLGSNIEQQWMRSLNLAITNWILELKASKHTLRGLIPLFSYAAVSTVGLWKVQLYCPIIAMDVQNSSNITEDQRLLLSLRYHQLEGVIQFSYKVIQRDKWIDIEVKIDNIRLDVIRLISDSVMVKRGAGLVEKHFPSRISLQLTPTFQTNVLSVSVSKSSENPIHEINLGKTFEGGFDAPTTLGLKLSTMGTTRTSLKPWKFEQSVYGYSANLSWFLHDSKDGREVVSSKPSKLAMCLPKVVWFKDRYSKASRPFTKQGGVVFAKDEYGQSVVWKVDKGATGNTMEWEIKRWIWLTNWPNRHRTFHNETRRFEFQDILRVSLV